MPVGQGLPVQDINMRKVAYAPEHYPGVKYDPNLQRPCTIFAGTFIQQVFEKAQNHSKYSSCLALLNT